MLPAQNRLKKAHDINRVYRQGKYGGGGAVSVKARRTGRPDSRAAVVVGKKVDKRAVVRNRNRRRLAAALFKLWPQVEAGYDIVVSVHQDLGETAASQLESLLSKALQNAGVKEKS
jgi:ribonuclease P protein component